MDAMWWVGGMKRQWERIVSIKSHLLAVSSPKGTTSVKDNLGSDLSRGGRGGTCDHGPRSRPEVQKRQSMIHGVRVGQV